MKKTNLFAALISLLMASTALAKGGSNEIEKILNDEPAKYDANWHRLTVQLRDEVANNRGVIRLALDGKEGEFGMLDYVPADKLSPERTKIVVLQFSTAEMSNVPSVEALEKLLPLEVKISQPVSRAESNEILSIESVFPTARKTLYVVVTLRNGTPNDNGNVSFLTESAGKVRVYMTQYSLEQDGKKSSPWFGRRLGILTDRARLELLKEELQKAKALGAGVPVEIYHQFN